MRNALELANALENAFPHINFKDGPAQSVDSHGSPYITYVLGRVKPEGEASTVVLNIAEGDLARLFYLDLHDVIARRQPKFIEWRRKPVVSLDRYVATVLPEASCEGLMISCRFSMRMNP